MEKIDLEKTFVGIVQQYERIIYKVCSFYASSELPIADLYQEVVGNLWIGFPKFRNDCSLSTWIYRVALNTCITGLTISNVATKLKRAKEKLKQMSNH